MSDVYFLVDGVRVNLRVGALIVHDGSVLVCRLPNAKWWFVPGGRVKVNETSLSAIERELTEELGSSFRVREPRVVSENFFLHEGARFHELCTYYLVDWLGGERFEGTERTTEEFQWIPSDALVSLDLKPSFLKKVFGKWDAPLELIIHHGEERQPNQALQTTPMTRSVYEKTIEFGDPQRGV